MSLDLELFPDAERSENRAEQVIAAVAAGDFAQRVLGMAQFFGGEFAGAVGQFGGGVLQMDVHLLQRQQVTAAGAEGAFAAAGTGQLLEVLAQVVEAGAGPGGGPQRSEERRVGKE